MRKAAAHLVLLRLYSRFRALLTNQATRAVHRLFPAFRINMPRRTVGCRITFLFLRAVSRGSLVIEANERQLAESEPAMKDQLSLKLTKCQRSTSQSGGRHFF